MNTKAIKILIIEDEIALRKSLKKLIQLRGYQVDEAADFTSAVNQIRSHNYDIYLLDLKLPDGHGLQLLKKYPGKMQARTIIMTAHATIPSAVDAIKSGAYYYLEKPLEEELLFIQIEKIVEIAQLKQKNLSFKNELISQHSSDEIIYKSQKMAEVVSMAREFAKTDDTVLLQGNTGVGKEIIAKFIHKNSKRKEKEFLPINCSSIPEQLFESELFGFKKGAFTGASENYSGRFLQADKGTLFLDEIGEIPMHLQAKLLRVLEDGVIYQLGKKQPQKVDARLIAATNKNLWEEVHADLFRKDLYFRLTESMITIPPLKERKDDIMPLVWHFISVFNDLFDKKINRIKKEAESYLMEYPWEGNVRELKNAIKSIFLLKSSDAISLNDILMSLHKDEKNFGETFVTLQEYELKYIKKVLEATNYNVKKTARILEISRARLYRKLKLLDINLEKEFDSVTEAETETENENP
ncbi:MAG: response regulator [Candidatus Aminicenantes bacterium]|nr:response regulator [Candidatus Aminicenantes bacterium]NIM78946.1 response regulator [Candidatus Aminicenantes bacterium]NIN18206.1 response regulator [Candidatus Aminicenantes bacterium]NIN42105.1 response regulator [Candidatus Aminicenantes bacterium]NIN84858.1 response regulator [Candidatus Aminicenantes bacterium]